MVVGGGHGGTTSACAENTTLYDTPPCGWWNYLRVRGEYPTRAMAPMMVSELPPRARRILPPTPFILPHLGTTSACAENTGSGFFHSFFLGNYLRVRGEYFTECPWAKRTRELPPRARRILRNTPPNPSVPGTTSACAENTISVVLVKALYRNYLRVRGEYSMILTSGNAGKELPPRARRIRSNSQTQCNERGTTSACAENT